MTSAVAANHRFNADEGDWGFTRFCELRRLFHQQWEDKQRSLVEGDAAQLTAYVRIVKDPTGVLWHNFVKYVANHSWKEALSNLVLQLRLKERDRSSRFEESRRNMLPQLPSTVAILYKFFPQGKASGEILGRFANLLGGLPNTHRSRTSQIKQRMDPTEIILLATD